tara:strand:- start:310 stop:1353 length:1044 start_codon:yes stop_codon:yes gene_type:complete
MAELFGAPLGMIAADEQSRQNTLVGLEAQKVMNTLALQPSQIALNQAHTEYYGAQTAEADAKVEAARVMQRLGEGFTADQQKLKGVIDGAAAQGKTATVADLKGAGQKVSTAQPLKDFAAYAAGKGASPTVLEKLYGKIATIEEKEAQGAWRNQQVLSDQDKTARDLRTEIGGIAAAAAENPQQYAAIMMNPDLRDRLPKQLTGSYDTDRPMLRAIGQASMDANKQADNRRQQAEAEARQARFEAGQTKRNAEVALTDAKYLLAVERFELLVKNGQAVTDAGIEAKKAVADAAKARTAAAQDKATPQLPLDPGSRKLGQSYMLPDGRTARWEVDPTTKKPGLNVLGD